MSDTRQIKITHNEIPAKFVSDLFHSQIQTHIFHLQTSKYAIHKALEDYYTAIGGLIDELVETYQHKNIIKNYTNNKYENITSPTYATEPIMYLENLLSFIKTHRNTFEGSDMQNIIDTIVSLIKSTLYKLTRLS